MNLPISPEMIPFFLAIGGILILIAGVLFISFSSVSIKSATTGQRGGNGIPADFRDQFIKAYNKVFSTFNMQPMNNMLTEFMYYSTQNTVKVLEKLGIKKEISVKIDSEFEKMNHFSMVFKDGKNDMSLDISKCRYTEIYSDERTNKKLYKRVLKNAVYNIEFLRSNEKLHKDLSCCMNCGDTLTRNGNFFDCQSCGAHYD